MSLKFSTTTNFGEITDFLNSVFSSPTHFPEWNLTISKYFKTDFFYNVCYAENKLIGIEPVHLISEGLVKKRYTGPKHFLMPYGGWIFSDMVSVIPDNIPSGTGEEYCGFTLPLIPEFGVTDYTTERTETKETLLADLTSELDDIWMKEISSKRRNMVRKAEKSGVTISVTPALMLPELYDIMKRSNDHYGLETFSKEFYDEVLNGSEAVFFETITAALESNILSVLLMVRTKDFAIYWQGLNNGGGPNIGQGELLQWEAIKHAKAAGCKYYDLCSIEKERLPKIYEFKRDFAKREVNFVNFSVRPALFKILNRINRVL